MLPDGYQTVIGEGSQRLFTSHAGSLILLGLRGNLPVHDNINMKFLTGM